MPRHSDSSAAHANASADVRPVSAATTTRGSAGINLRPEMVCRAVEVGPVTAVVVKLTLVSSVMDAAVAATGPVDRADAQPISARGADGVETPCRSGGRTSGSRQGDSGSLTVMVVPTPELLATAIVP